MPTKKTATKSANKPAPKPQPEPQGDPILAEIDAAVKSNNGSVIGQYLAHEDPSVRAAAEEALEQISQSDAIDETPVVEEPEDEVGIPLAGDSNDPEAPMAPIRPKEWIRMLPDKAKKYEQEGRLCGYIPAKGIGLLKK